MVQYSDDSPLNPYDLPPVWSMDDTEGTKRGRLELRYVFYDRADKPQPQSPEDVKIETAAVLTRVLGYGTAAIAKRMYDINFTLMQERHVAEILTFHDWMSTDGYSFQAKETLFGAIANPLMRRRLREVRILCSRGLFSTVVDAGLRLSGVKNTLVLHDESAFHREVVSTLKRYENRTNTRRLADPSAIAPK